MPLKSEMAIFLEDMLEDGPSQYLLALIGVVILFWFLFKKSSGNRSYTRSQSGFRRIADNFTTLEEVQQALRKAGLESSNLIVGVDYTKSNEYTGQRTFGGKCLHHIEGLHADARPNPYQRVIDVVTRTLEPFDDDRLIPAFGFGDQTTTDRAVFPFVSDRACRGGKEVLEKYNEITPLLTLSGPTSFAPLIHTAINIVKENRAYHILIIIADGQVINERDTVNAIVEASKYPLSIIMVGVGDGPWDMMEEFDDGLPQRQFDNFQFVNFNQTMRHGVVSPDVKFAVDALQEIPDQFKEIRRLRLL
eukprot:TRINITY_DN6373_c0_g1_i1.p1 TRINITY_DN6373_c0_g1~~TRINITY_DN6373_c0_g1_i1.p1  ORF type:complete len:305 (-),score=71.47 TRINITY_DN6373_c0_g1_i1:159-1073(-)